MTRVLALETAGRGGSVAVLEDDRLLTTRAFAASERTTQALHPAIAELLATVSWQPRDVELLAVARGPGSFTGLRVGVTVAKTFAYVVGCPLVGVDTLTAVAEQSFQALDATEPDPKLAVVLDAQRGQLFVRTLGREAGTIVGGEGVFMDAATWLAERAVGPWLSGPALPTLRSRLPSTVRLAPESTWEPRAATIGVLGYRAFVAGNLDSPWTLAPTYLRPSAAEERAQERAPVLRGRLETSQGNG